MLTILIHLPQLYKTCNNSVHVLDVSLYATEKLTTTYQAYKKFNYAVFLHPMPTDMKINIIQ